MLRICTVAGSLVAVSLAFVEDVAAHGGIYRGPPDIVPPVTGPTGGGGPGPTTPGPDGPGPNTPGPGTRGPQTPGPGGPSTGGGGGSSRGPSTGLGKKNRPSSYGSWSSWWEVNKDRYLELRSHLGGSTEATGNAAFLTGYGNKAKATGSERPTAGDIRDRLIPSLIELLSAKDADVVDSAALALGRVARSEHASLVRDGLSQAMKSEYASARQASILAFGILGDRAAAPILEQVMLDSDPGRAALGLKGGVQVLTRSLAAVALGQIADPSIVPSLKEVVKDTDETSDVRIAAVLALARFDDQNSEVVPFLVDRLRDDRLERQVRAQVPVALGRLGDAATPAIPDLLRIVRSRRHSPRLVESAVVALGQLASMDDAEVIAALVKFVKEGDAKEGRHFAIVGLGQVLAHGSAGSTDSARSDVTKTLLRELTKPSSQSHPPFAALALGIAARAMDDSARERNTIIVKLQEAFEGENQPSNRAAMAIGMGLARAEGKPAELIYEAMLDEKETTTKGYLALSLGMLSHASARDTLATMIFDNRDPVLRVQSATALGLLGDRDAAPSLVDALKEAETLNVVASLAKAIALIGDRSALDPLLELAGDESSRGIARGFACVALGSIADRDPLPWNASWIENTNYFAMTPVFAELSSL